MDRLTTRCAGHAIMAWEHEEQHTTQEWIDLLTDRLAYYEDLEEQGRMMILPCETDAIVWYKSGNNLAVSRFDGQCVLDNDGCLYYKLNGEDVFGEEIGKTVFLSREEAEAALRGEV